MITIDLIGNSDEILVEEKIEQYVKKTEIKKQQYFYEKTLELQLVKIED